MSIEAMKQALEIIKNMRSGYGDDYHTGKEWTAMDALRQAIEQAEKQTHTDHPSRHWDRTCPACVAEVEKEGKWVGLTDNDLENQFGFIDEWLRYYAYRIEAKLRERNT